MVLAPPEGEKGATVTVGKNLVLEGRVQTEALKLGLVDLLESTDELWEFKNVFAEIFRGKGHDVCNLSVSEKNMCTHI